MKFLSPVSRALTICFDISPRSRTGLLSIAIFNGLNRKFYNFLVWQRIGQTDSGLERDYSMKKLIHINIVFAVIFIFGMTAFAQSQKDCQPPNVFDYDDEHILTVNAETLLQKPKCYDGKFIRTIGFYSFGFEMSSLYCLTCGNNRTAWFNLENYYAAIKRCTSPENFKKLDSKNGATLGVVVLGVMKTKLTFENQDAPKDIGSKRLSETVGGFGHMNAYDSEFSPICFEEVEVFSKYSVADDEKTQNRMKKWYEKMIEKY